MTRLRYTIVDVFTEVKYAGNQLAVFRDVHDLSGELMQQIAREINYSETTFIRSDQPTDDGYDVRIFTPREEVPFAGHPTIGTAHIIYEKILQGKADSVTLKLKAGRIPVMRSRDGYLWMQQIPPTFSTIHAAGELANVIGLGVDEIDAHYPIQEVSTGLPFFIVPLKHHSSLKNARIDKQKYFDLIEHTTAKGILVFSPETHDPHNDLSVRVFVDYYGIPEDPATGSANGCLAGYLVRNRYLGQERVDCRVEQGREIGRPSILLLKAEQDGDNISITVGGKSVIVAEGEFL